MKSHIAPGMSLFQIVVLDFKRRQPPPASVVQSGQVHKRYNDIQETVPKRTIFKWAKDGKRAKKWGARFGSVIACFKVDSHERRLNMIEHLRLDKPIAVDLGADEFVVGRDLEIEPLEKIGEIDVNGT